MYGHVIFVRYPFAEGESVYGFYTDEKRAEESLGHCNDYRDTVPAENRPEYRMVRAELNELPDDIDADNERTLAQIQTVDEMNTGSDYIYLDHDPLV